MEVQLMLVKCPECELQVSDKAPACPHCGYPMKPSVKRKPRAKNNKRRRLPNGFGQISEIKNRNLRNPFRAMVTVGKTQDGKPICKPLKPDSYFSTYNDAYAALVEYNKNPYDLGAAITVKELYDKWSEEYFKTLKSSRYFSLEVLLGCLRYASDGCPCPPCERLHGRRCCHCQRGRAARQRIHEEQDQVFVQPDA